jgi:predicted transcriptional regulator
LKLTSEQPRCKEASKGVLTVTQIDYIKHLRENEGASISEIASRLKCSWKTAKKYDDGEVDLQKRHRR